MDNTKTCLQYHGLLFEYYVTTTRRDIYNIMCSIEDHERERTNINYDASSGCGIPLSPNPKKYVLVSFGLALNFIEIWIK